MLIAVQILLLIFMVSISAALTQINLVDGATENNSTSDNATAKNEDVFALLQLEKDVAKYEGSLKELHSGKKSPFDLLGEVKNEEKFKPESGSFLPEYDDNSKDNNG
jgi:hypothetical protein